MTVARGLLGILACALLVSGCAPSTDSSTGPGGGDAPRPTETSAELVDCRALFDTVIERERVDDTSGAIDADLDVLRDLCPSAYRVYVDYASIKAVSRVDPGATCPDPLAFNADPEAIELARRDGLCSDPGPASAPSSEPGSGPGDLGDADWTCTYEPTYNYDWHDDVLCSNGTTADRPYLREWDDYITEDEIMESAREYEQQLNGG